MKRVFPHQRHLSGDHQFSADTTPGGSPPPDGNGTHQIIANGRSTRRKDVTQNVDDLHALYRSEWDWDSEMCLKLIVHTELLFQQ